MTTHHCAPGTMWESSMLNPMDLIGKTVEAGEELEGRRIAPPCPSGMRQRLFKSDKAISK
jgi:hypothetical protein